MSCASWFLASYTGGSSMENGWDTGAGVGNAVYVTAQTNALAFRLRADAWQGVRWSHNEGIWSGMNAGSTPPRLECVRRVERVILPRQWLDEHVISDHLRAFESTHGHVWAGRRAGVRQAHRVRWIPGNRPPTSSTTLHGSDTAAMASVLPVCPCCPYCATSQANAAVAIVAAQRDPRVQS